MAMRHYVKRLRWWCRFPGEVYANNFDFSRPVTEAEARDDMRRWLGVDRLPRGTEVWPGAGKSAWRMAR